MQFSFLIVTKNRSEALRFSLLKLRNQIDIRYHEVLVFIDGCAETELLVAEFEWVHWTISKKSISASPARNELYKKANGVFFIGLDDDAHLITQDFISKVQHTFEIDQTLGIIAFQEIRGSFISDESAMKHFHKRDSYYTSDFVGCGFAIKSEVYKLTNGFPTWMTIYGEESAVALEVIDLGYRIRYENDIAVNHRIDPKQRTEQGRNYYRFENQLHNMIRFYLIYHPAPALKIAKLLFHNFKKYGLIDLRYLQLFLKVVGKTFFDSKRILKLRSPVRHSTFLTIKELDSIQYS